MKQLTIILTLILTTSSAYAQFNCNTIDFHSDTVYIDQSTDLYATMAFDFDWQVNPMVNYPRHTISLNDTTNFVFRDEYLGFVLIGGAINFNITYKNPSIPNGYTVIGSFNTEGNDTVGPVSCQNPVVFIFNTPLSIDNIINEKNVNVYPNPTTGKITLNLEEKINIKATLMNSLGQTVFTNNYTSTNTIQLEIDGPKGIYFLQLESENGAIITKKILKE